MTGNKTKGKTRNGGTKKKGIDMPGNKKKPVNQNTGKTKRK